MEENKGRNPQKAETSQEIDLEKLFKAVWKNIWLLIVGMLAGGVIALLVTLFLIHPAYRSGFTAYVNNHSQSDSTSSLNSGDTSASESLALTYAHIMESRSLIEDAARGAGLNGKYSDDRLAGCVHSDVENSTQLLNVYVTMGDPDDAYKMAKAMADAAPEYIANIVEGSSMKIVSDPRYPNYPYSPSRKKNTAIGIILGALLILVYIVIRELTDTRVKNQDELEDMFGIPVLGTIPNFRSAAPGRDYGYGSRYGDSRAKKGGEQ